MEAIKDDTSLENFFSEALCFDSAKSAFHPQLKDLPLKNVVKGVSFSGWNPPPSNRRMQGDLSYLEVILATEGTVYITATVQ
jgi:hypothetical protein